MNTQPKKAINGILAPLTMTASVIVSLHPLVIMNISEHWTRIKTQQGKSTQGC